MVSFRTLLSSACVVGLITPGIVAAKNKEELAKKLTNPVASLISVPFQYNYDENIGPNDDGERHTLNIQPVLPFSLNDDWNLISRTILPVIDQTNIAPGSGNQTGTGDIVQSLFFSPKEPTAGGWILGAGPVFLLPTGSEDELTADRWGVGPTAVALRQNGPWTYGALFNHIFDVTGDNDRADVNSTFLQPFLAYTTPEAITFALNTEATYDWEGNEGSVPIHFQVNKVTDIGRQTVSLGGGLRYWAQSTDNGPEGWGFRLQMVLLYPH
ncbi:MAG: transporter [Pseudomonas sp.]